MSKLINLLDYEQIASDHLSASAYGYYVGGADDEVTLAANRSAWQAVQLAPKMLRDVSHINTSTNIFDGEFSAPLLVAPMALMKLAHTEGEVAMARAAASRGVGIALSTLSTVSLEDVQKIAPTPLWFQLYVYKDRGLTKSLVQRADAAGYQALVLTVDAPIAGNRERDVRNTFKLPPEIKLANLTDYALENMSDATDDSAIAAYAASQLDDSLTWSDIAWLRSITNLPILVKGILRADDALRAMDYGASGVIISNHGGRQLDTTPAAIDVLKQFHDKGIQLNGEILIDGGVRRGTDILKSLALGASGVLVGRPILWGLAANGEDGVSHVLQILIEEFERAMALSGCTSVTEIDDTLIFG